MAVIHYTIPDELHRRVKAAAALAGITQKEFLERALEAAVERATESRDGTEDN